VVDDELGYDYRRTPLAFMYFWQCRPNLEARDIWRGEGAGERVLTKSGFDGGLVDVLSPAADNSGRASVMFHVHHPAAPIGS
jgi:hypothetical protein